MPPILAPQDPIALGARHRAQLGVATVCAVACLLASRPVQPDITLDRDAVRLRIDPNAAPRAELMLLPDIGPSLADAIIESRAREPFRSPADLDRVRGIGPKTLAGVTPWLSFDAAADSP